MIHKAKGANVVTVIQEGRAHRGWNFRVTMLVALLAWAVLFLAFFGLLALIGWAT